MKLRFASIFAPLFFAIAGSIAFVSCSDPAEPDGDPSSSSGGNNSACEEFPNSERCQSSSSDGGNSSPGGGSSSSDGSGGSSSSGVGGGGSSSSGGGSGSSSSGGGGNSSSSGNGGGGNSSSDGGGLDVPNAIEIRYNSGSAPIVTKSASEVQVETNGENVVVRVPDATTVEYNLVLSGTASNGSLKVYGDVRKGLYLNGVSITNSSGPAINIQKSGRVEVHLVNGTTNSLTDGSAYNSPTSTGEDAKGAFFSEGKLYFTGGNGTLEVRGKNNHAIAVDNDFEIDDGKIIVKEAKNDGIHVNDKIEVKGGTLDITSARDAIQSESEEQGSDAIIDISGGNITIKTTGIKSHGITGESSILIRGSANIQIEVEGNGSKGIRARNWAEFDGGETVIKTKGNRDIDNTASPPDTSTAAGLKIEKDLFISGGRLDIKSEGSRSKGINADANAKITGGNVRVEAQDDGIKVNGNLIIESGATVYVKSSTKAAIDVDGTSTGVNGSNVTKVDGGL